MRPSAPATRKALSRLSAWALTLVPAAIRTARRLHVVAARGVDQGALVVGKGGGGHGGHDRQQQAGKKQLQTILHRAAKYPRRWHLPNMYGTIAA